MANRKVRRPASCNETANEIWIRVASGSVVAAGMNGYHDDVIEHLTGKCADELWKGFHEELMPFLPKHETSAMHGYVKSL